MVKTSIVGSGGGGVSSADVTATLAEVLSGKTALTSDSKDGIGVGTMANHGAVAPAALVAGGSYTIPKGYHNGAGKVVAKDLASQTPGTAGAADIRKSKTAVVNGKTITGTMAERGAATITPKTTNQTIAANQFLTGVQTIAGDADLTAGNIRTGVNIFGVGGTYKGRGNAVQANVEAGKTFSTASLDNASGSMAVMSGGTYNPSKSVQTISCSGKKMSSNITIGAIPSNYVDLTSGGVVFKDGVWGFLGIPYSAFDSFGGGGTIDNVTLSGNVPNATAGVNGYSPGTDNCAVFGNQILYYGNGGYEGVGPWQDGTGMLFKKTMNFNQVNKLKIYCSSSKWSGQVSDTYGRNWCIGVYLYPSNKQDRQFVGWIPGDYDTYDSGYVANKWYELDLTAYKGHYWLYMFYYGKDRYNCATGGLSQIIISS